MRPSIIKILIATLGLIGALPCIALADTETNTKLAVEAGWGSQPRSGRWTPIFVTASDPKTRNVVLEVEWPVGGSYTMHVEQAMTIDSNPRTFPLLLPVQGWVYQQAEFTLRDRDTDKTLAHFPKDPDSPTPLFNGGYSDPNSAFVGMSGSRSGFMSFQPALNMSNVAFMPTNQLPTNPLGYDSLDLLILNEPRLAQTNSGPAGLDDEQQQAIVDWVRAGGKLILWPGNAGFPTSGVLADILPAKVVGAENIDLSRQDLDAVGLPGRFKTLAVHRLEPRTGAKSVPLPNLPKLSAYSADFGLGKIVLVPVNIADFQIADTAKCRNLWRPLLKGIIKVAEEKTDGDAPTPPPYMNYGYGGGDSHDANASMCIADFLGDVAGAGQFGFSYVIYVLIGLMVVVGPVDWLVLKKLGRQPWTWVTTGGWIALVTLGALFAGYMFKSGDLHYRTLQTIDQVGNTTVGGTDYVSLYSSRTRNYQIKTAGDGWWQPGGVSEGGGSGLGIGIDFHQTNEGNTPEEMLVNVWSLRFLRGTHMGAGPAVVAADLHRETSTQDSRVSIVGTITNLMDRPLKNVRIESRNGLGTCEMKLAGISTTMPVSQSACVEIPPHAMVRIHVLPDPAANLQATVDEQNTPYYGYRKTTAPAAENLWKAAADLDYRRGKQMNERVSTGSSVIIYAETADPTPAAELFGQKAIEKHYQFVRALVDLHEEGGK